jgi:hypothetical protein
MRAEKTRRRRATKGLRAPDDIAPLSAAQLRELERRVKDLDDPRRYIIKSVLFPGPPRRWELFYDVSNDLWAMDIESATLFKRRKTAVAVARHLDDRYKIEEVKLGRGKRLMRSRRPTRK